MEKDCALYVLTSGLDTFRESPQQAEKSVFSGRVFNTVQNVHHRLKKFAPAREFTDCEEPLNARAETNIIGC